MTGAGRRFTVCVCAATFSLLVSSGAVAQVTTPGKGAETYTDTPIVPFSQKKLPALGGANPTAGVPNAAPAIDSTVDVTGHVASEATSADKLLSKGKYAEAEEMFRELLVNNPQDLSATVGLGIALAKQFKLDAADEMFDRVLLQNPNSALAYAGKATVISNRLQSSSNTIRSNRDSWLKQAEQYAKQACTLAPASAESHFALGQVLKEQGNNDEALSELRTAVQLDPSHSYAYSSIGEITLAKNSLGEAQENFKRAIELNSGNSTAHYGLGATLLKLGAVDDALKELNISLYQFPNSWPVHMKLGEAYQQQGNLVAAQKEYQQSIMIKPENSQPYLKIADIRESKGDLELALSELRSGQSMMPYDLDLRQRIAEMCLKLEKADDAIKEFKTILRMGPNDHRAVKGLTKALCLKAQKEAAGALLASNDYESALKSLDEAIKLSPNDMELRLAKAKLQALSGTTPEISNLGEPTNDGERLALAEALMARGDFQKSSQLLQKVIADLDDPAQSFAVADVAVLIKDLDNAEAAYKKAQSLSGSPQRVERGLASVAKFRSDAAADVKVATELSKKRQYDGAIDRFRHAISLNPRNAEARYGLGDALENKKNPTSLTYAEAALQYKNYLLLATNLPKGDIEDVQDDIEKMQEKSAKMAKKESRDREG